MTCRVDTLSLYPPYTKFNKVELYKMYFQQYIQQLFFFHQYLQLLPMQHVYQYIEDD